MYTIPPNLSQLIIHNNPVIHCFVIFIDKTLLYKQKGITVLTSLTGGAERKRLDYS
jgi:hypothetical protein